MLGAEGALMARNGMGTMRKVKSGAFAGAAALALAGAAVSHAQQGAPAPGPGPQGPPLPGPVKVEADELAETWNGRVSVGPPVGAFPEFEGWTMGLAMPL